MAPSTQYGNTPFKLVIIDNRGGVVFIGEADRNGKLRHAGSLCRVCRAHFPANAFTTDGALAMRTSRIDRPAYRTLYRPLLSAEQAPSDDQAAEAGGLTKTPTPERLAADPASLQKR